MSKNQSLRVTAVQFRKQPLQRILLRRSACVHGSLAVSSQPSDITHPDRMNVMVSAVRADNSLRPSNLDSAVSRNHIVITATLPSQAAMIAVDVRHPQGTARLVGGAVHDNQSNGSHCQSETAIPPAAPEIINSNTLTM